MTRNEARLLRVFLWTGLACAAVLLCVTQLERIESLENAERDYRQRTERLGAATLDEEAATARLEELTRLVEETEAGTRNAPLAEFGHEVRSRLAAQGIVPTRYQVVSASGKDQLEFSFRCSSLAFARFLRGVQLEEGHWTVPYLSLKSDAATGMASIVVRLSDDR